MEQIIAQVMLPLVLAIVMLGMGLSLKIQDFKEVLSKPKIALLGFLLQLFLLPILALLIIKIFGLNQQAAAGLFLLALCPGGATSNLFSFLAKANVALSVCLTGVVSMLSPIILPIAFVAFVQYNGSMESQAFSLPLLPAMKKLALVTLLPTFIGMCISHWASAWSESVLPLIKKVSAIAMLLVIGALIMANQNIIPAMFSVNGVAVMTLCTVSLFIAYFIATKCHIDGADRKTITLEVGVQNAGTAMMVALSIMHQPGLAVIPLMYGLLMNIPAFGFVWWILNKDKCTVPLGIKP